MGEKESPTVETIPSSNEPRVTIQEASVNRAQDHISSDTDTTATNSSDEFDWDEDEDAKNASQVEGKAKRGRALWLGFMKLSRPFRALLIGILGAGILATPLIVFDLRFHSSPARLQVHIWSMWLGKLSLSICSGMNLTAIAAIVWAAGCITYLAVDAIPKLLISIIVLFGGQAERLKIQIEVGTFSI